VGARQRRRSKTVSKPDGLGKVPRVGCLYLRRKGNALSGRKLLSLSGEKDMLKLEPSYLFLLG
jgi:hypothetical protein